MYRLIIVEDEKWEREGLRDYLDWKSLGVEVVGCASNGVEGLSLSEQINPDIILTDIRMPKMDGLRMSKKIRTFLPDAKIIILSGYDDFGYAKQTFEFHAFDYILKPIVKEKIQEVIERAVSALDSEKSIESERAGLRSKLMEYIYENKNRLLLNILEGDETEFTSEGLPVSVLDPNARIIIAVMSISNMAFGNKRLDMDGFEAILQEREMAFSLTKPFKEVVLCMEAPETQEGLRIKLVELVNYLKNEFNIDIIISVGEAVNGFSEASASYSQAREAHCFRFLAQYGDILFYDDIKEKNLMKSDFARPMVMKTHENIKKLLSGNLLNQSEELGSLLDCFLMTLKEICPLSKLLLNKFFTQALININPAAFIENSEDFKECILDKSRFEEKFLKLDSINETKQYLMDFLKAISAYAINSSSNADAEVAQKVIKIIEQRYSEDIDLKSISKDIHLTPYYIGTIFKKNTGKTFNKYLSDYRIDRAKEILQAGKVNVSQLSDAVGIKNTSYFCSLFKDRFGISPGDYKELVKGGN